MADQLIEDQHEFEELCERIRRVGSVAFDTEFVSENTYRPELCLLQFEVDGDCIAVDPQQVRDLTPWWELMVDESTEILVHAGREEVRFCVTRTGKRPRNVVDIQIAQGIIGRSYPLGYTALVGRVLGNEVHSTQTRTDWRKRPLTDNQIRYALDDVLYVRPIWESQLATLNEQGRTAWARAEFERMVDEVGAERSGEQWRKLSGVQKLRPRELGIVAALFDWRDQRAAADDRPARRILRDDLLVDLARRKPKTGKDVLANRDMNRSHLKRAADDIAQVIQHALELPDSELPERIKAPTGDRKLDEEVLGRLLGIALANRCAELEISTALVGTNADLRELVRWHVYGGRKGAPPRLGQGWRAEVCGDLLTDVLDGKISLRVANLSSDHPLVFERRDDS